MYDQWALVEGDESTLRAIAAEVPLDPGFGPLTDDLRARGAEITVVSDGFGFYVEEACAPLGLEVLTNTIDFSTPRAPVPPRGPLLPVLNVRRLQAGADQGREVPRADHRSHRRRRERSQGSAAR